MESLPDIISALVEPIALIALLTVGYGFIRRSGQSRAVQQFLMGVIFSVTTLYSMTNPINVADGVFFDLRTLTLGTATVLIGPWAGLMVMISSGVYRIELGGPGVLAGNMSLVVGFVMAMLWLMLDRRFSLGRITKPLSLGLMISCNNAAGVLLPHELWPLVFGKVVPVVVFANVVGCFFIYALIEREMRLLRYTRKLSEEAATDHLTGLTNRRRFEDDYPKRVFEMRDGRGVALMYFDIDFFKSINDTYGHRAGDIVLKTVAERLRGEMRDGDDFCRLGGDEFAILLPDVGKPEASIVAERCLNRVANEPIEYEDQKIPITISIGLSWMSRASDFQTDMARADAALYRAKNAGRNRVSVSDHTTRDEKLARALAMSA